MMLCRTRVAGDPGEQRVVATMRVGPRAEQCIKSMLGRLVTLVAELEIEPEATQPRRSDLKNQRRLGFSSGGKIQQALLDEL